MEAAPPTTGQRVFPSGATNRARAKWSEQALLSNVSLAEARAHASVITRIFVLGDFWGKPQNR